MAELDTTELGSVGTVVGAVMETAGHFMQSAFIDTFESGLATSLGGLLYVTAILSALTIVALGGNYKFGRWFLFGPILFYALVFVRVDSCGVVVRHGDRVVDPEVIWDKSKGLANIGRIADGDNALRASVSEDGNLCAESPARISAVFELWNNLTSSVINSFVKLLRLDQRGADFDFISKVDRFTSLFTENIDDPIINDIVSSIVQTSCGDAYATAQQLIVPNLADYQKQALDERLKKEMARVVVNPQEIARVKQFIKQRATVDPDKDEDGLLTCQELWGLATDVLRTHALDIFAGIADVGEIADKDQRAREVLQRLAKKFALAYNTKTGEFAVLQEQEAIVGIINEKAVRLFLENLRQLNPSLRKGDLNATQYRSLVGDVGGKEEMADSIRSASATEEFREKGRFLQTMMSLPYVQGILLYFLAMLYPFFCVFAILPGRHETVMMWFGLWFWVKLWDFGFAVVMLIDELMYTLMPHSPFISDAALADPVAAFKSALSVDPTYSVYVYYNIMASCLAAVPILTAAAVKRGTGPITGVINKAMSSFAGNPGGSFGSYAGSRKANTNLAQARTMQHNMLVDAMYRQFKNSKVEPMLIAATAMKAGAAMMNGRDDVRSVFNKLADKAAQDAKKPNIGAEERARLEKMSQSYREGVSWVSDKVGQNPVMKTLAKYIDLKGDQEFRKAVAEHSYYVASDMYKQSTALMVDYLNADSRQHGYYDHPFRAPYPQAQYLSLLQQNLYLNWQQATSTFTESMVNTVVPNFDSVITKTSKADSDL